MINILFFKTTEAIAKLSPKDTFYYELTDDITDIIHYVTDKEHN